MKPPGTGRAHRAKGQPCRRLAFRKPNRHGPGPSQQGAALLLAMIILVMVTTVTAGMVWHQTRAVQVEGAERARVQSAWILNGALDWARLILREDLRNNRSRSNPYDGLDEPWATPLEEARLSAFLAADKDNNADSGPEAFISGSIADAQARFNLRSLIDDAGKPVPVQVAALQRLCTAVGAPSDAAERLAQVLTSLQATGAAAAGGASGAATGGAGTAVTSAADAAALANQPLAAQRYGDLAWRGIEGSLLQLLAPWVDLLPSRTPVNVNTASRETLLAAIDGLDLGGAQRLLLARQRKSFEKLDDVKAQLSPDVVLDPVRISVGSAYFLVSGRLRLEDRVLEERSLVVRRDGRVDVLRRERQSFALSSR